MPRKDKPTIPEAPAPVETPASPAGDADVHAGRRYSVGTTVKKGKRKVRYVETNDPKKGCRFL
jgi:hypothetical protein